MASNSIAFDGTNFGVQVGNNFGTITTSEHQIRLLFLYLDDKLPTVGGATFNSWENQHEDKCLPGTRTDLIAQIKEWGMSSEGRCIFWLNGMAGTGKSTISRTVAQLFHEEKALGASFFFRRGEADRGNAKKFFPMIAKQLAKSLPDLLPHVHKAVLDNPGIVENSTREQFDKLLFQPFLHLGVEQSTLPIQTIVIRTIVIVIDALDECEGDDDIHLILQLLPQLRRLGPRHTHSLNVRVFLTSRPELPIRLGFSRMAPDNHTDFLLHEIPNDVIKHDISLFMSQRLSKIRDSNNELGNTLSSDWPGKANLEKLVDLSIPLFIFAATVCRILGDSNWDPIESLAVIFARRYDQSDNGMGKAYLPVLDRLLTGHNKTQYRRLVQEFQHVLGSIVILESSLSVVSLSALLGLPERTVQLRLNSLHSIINIPSVNTLPIRIFHLSFREFLLDPETRKKTPFGVDANEAHRNLAFRCILTMDQQLRRNMCALPNDGALKTEIRSTAYHHISVELQYACRYWAYHLVQMKDTSFSDMTNQVLALLQKHFLHWLEAMSLLGVLSDAGRMLRLLKSNIPSDNVRYHNLYSFLRDSERFILKSYQTADEAPLQLYSSALTFAPRTSIIRAQFDNEIPPYISRLPDVEETWGSELQTLQGHRAGVSCVVFSPNGQILASGSRDMNVRLWDMETGALRSILKGFCLAFSPDGRLLASGSGGDRKIMIWNVSTGTSLHTLNGYYYHPEWFRGLRCIVFSPDGGLLACGSNDTTVRVWDTTRERLWLKLELVGHSSRVRSIAFSADGKLIISCSDDSSVKIWDAYSGNLWKTLLGHSGPIWRLALAPNGHLLASGSDDGTVNLWKFNFESLHCTLRGHRSWVRSLAFSPDNLLLASGSGDSTIKIWEPTTGVLQRTLRGHSAPVWSITFGLKGRLASTSEDMTIRLWNPQTGALDHILGGHSKIVRSLAFSPDGQILASGSYDTNIKLWDTNTMPVPPTKPIAHSSLVISMVFSPDGKLLASGSSDRTAKIWNTLTGSLQFTLKGHMELVRFVVFSPNSLLLASASDDKTLKLWDSTTGALICTLNTHSNWVVSHCFSHDGTLLAFIQDTNKVILFDVNKRTTKYTLDGHSDRVILIAFSPGNQYFASGSNDNTIILWDTLSDSSKLILVGHKSSITSVIFSPNGLLLASGSKNGTIRLWSVLDGAPLHIIPISGATVWSVAFSPDSRHLAFGLGNDAVWLWNVASKSFRSLLNVREKITQLRFTSDGHHLITNCGIISTQSWLHHTATRPTLDLFVWEDQWIVLNGERALRLPVEYRASCMAFQHNLVALGHASGRISFLGFRKT